MAPVAGLFCLLLTCGIVQLAKSVNFEGLLPSHPPEHIAGVTYEVLDVFQSYPVDRRNTDQFFKTIGSCNGLSGNRETIHTDTGATRRLVLDPCYTALQNCRYDESMSDRVSFCVSTDLHRRYDFMELNNNQSHTYGRNPTGKCLSGKFRTYVREGNWYPCVCDCENSAIKADRYFSLLDVVADDDKVVTGVRFRKFKHVFYIQIQQARLGLNKFIREKDGWKDIETLSDAMPEFRRNELVYKVTTEQNTVLLDDLFGASNEVLTGLRFRQVGQDLRLEMHVTPFHEATRALARNASRWIHNDVDRSYRSEWKLKATDVPNRHDPSTVLSFGNQFVKFRVSNFKTDLGQTTVPLIDTRDVVTDHKLGPITGVGIAIHGTKNSAGFLALRILYHDE